ncbi:phage tail protein [Staphylococcus equorum]|uniref:phage tail protein n=1 Tax=Staphylococcus equorum TaxID=246432 RepID=UPI000E69EEAE|nr:terminase [Staphylococcus equorum]RIL48115.1 terminase [Staphylococcus equorum]
MESNFVAKIYAIIRNFERNIRKAQRLARTSVPNEINVDVTADLRKLQKKLTRAKGILTTIPPQKEVNIDAKVKKAQYNIRRLTQNLYTLPNNKNVNIDANVTKAQFKLNKISQTLRTLPKKETIKIDVDATATSKLQRVFQNIEKQINHFKGNVDRLAGDIKSFGIVFSQAFKGIMLTSIQGLIPIIAGLVPSLFAVLNAVKVLTGGVVAFAGAGAVGFGGFVAYAGMAITAIKMLEDGTIEASSATQKYQTALESVKSTWQDIVKQNANAIFESMANGLNTVKSASKSLTPFLIGVADGVNIASKKMLEWAENSKVAQKFFAMMNKTGISIFNKLLNAAGRFGDALINVFTQLAPLFQWSANWLERLGQSFQKWANSATGQNSIKQFMEYTRKNLPIIGNIFKNVFDGIFNLMKAFGQNSTNIFKYLDKMSAKFRNWSETIGKSEGFKKFIDYMQKNGPVIMQLIGNIIKLLFEFGKAIAPIASAILKVVTKVIGFTAALMENHPWIAKVAAVAAILFGAIWSLAVPLIAVNSFLGLFDLSLLKLAKRFLTSGAATKIFSGVINLLKGAIGFLLNPIGNLVKLLPLLSGAFTALTGPVGIVIGIIAGLVGAVVYLWKTNEDFRNFITKAWEDLTKAIGDAIEGIISWFQELWSNIQSTLKPIMPILESLGQVFSKVFGIQVMLIISQVIIAFQTLWTVIQIAGQIIGTIISIAVNTIVSLFTALIQFLTGDFGGAWQTLKNMVSTNLELIWQAILNIWDIITGYLSSVLNRILGIFGTRWQQIWSTVSSKVSQIWSTITSKFSALVGSISGFVSKWVSKIVNGFNQMVSNAANGMARFINKIIDGFVRVVSSVGEGVSNAVSKARSFVSDFVQAGVDLIVGMIQGIINKAKDLAQAAWNAAKGALSAAKNALDSHSPSREFIKLGNDSMSGLGIGIAQYANKAARESKLAAIKVMDAFKVDLSSGIIEGLGSSLKNDINAHMTKEIRHSMQENNRPIVNIEVRNEADIELIKTQIDDISSRETAIGQF